MNNILYCSDIQDIINEYILNIYLVMAWRHTCHYNMTKQYRVIVHNHKNCFKYINNKPYLHDMFKVIGISKMPYYIDDLDIVKCKYLQYLNCKYINGITILPTSLTTLVCNKVFTDSSILNLINLTTLDLYKNELISDKSISTLTKLTKLTIPSIKSDISDKSLSKLINLTYLDLNYNNTCLITNTCISQLTALKTLRITCNKYIDNVNIPNLKILHANRLLTDYSIGLSLTHLYCVNNDEFTDKLFLNLPNLIYLNCGYNNNFTDNALIKLPNLKCLECGLNLKFTDYGLSKLHNLEVLNCGYNTNFTNISLHYMPKLKYLNYNKITNINKLINLRINNNKFLNINN